VYSTATGTWVVTPAPLTVTANDQSKYLGETFTFSGAEFTSDGLKNGETIGLTTLSSPGQPASANLVGSPYTIYISDARGGTFNPNNYQITYVTGLLTVKPPPVQFNTTPSGPGGSQSSTNISFQSSSAHVSFTTGHSNSSGPGAGGVTGGLGDSGKKNATNNGRTYLPISEYDPAQYATGQLPDYAGRDGEATIFTMIDRGINQDNAANFHIDNFWNTDTDDKQGMSDPTPLSPKVTFTDGAGKDLPPTDSNAFPIVAGTTDLGQMLGKGPVMIEGALPQDGSPAQWLLAINLTGDGKGIIANDPISGQQVILTYDPDTKTVGAIETIFNPASKSWVPVAKANTVQVAGDPTAPALDVTAALQGFVPTGYFAVTIH
jgi:hypothetical protein